MALSRYVVTTTTTVPAGTPATVTAGEPGSGGASGFGSAATSAGAVLWPQTFIAGTTIIPGPGCRAVHRPERQPAPVRAGPG
jgi:hypothetical protein